jgi:hypothetical protein
MAGAGAACPACGRGGAAGGRRAALLAARAFMEQNITRVARVIVFTEVLQSNESGFIKQNELVYAYESPFSTRSSSRRFNKTLRETQAKMQLRLGR